MRRRGRLFAEVCLSLLLLVILSPSAFACATCFGKSDSALARGMNMGIFSLLVVIGVVLSSVAGFFVFLARRSAQLSARATAPAESSEITSRSQSC